MLKNYNNYFFQIKMISQLKKAYNYELFLKLTTYYLTTVWLGTWTLLHLLIFTGEVEDENPEEGGRYNDYHYWTDYWLK